MTATHTFFDTLTVHQETGPGINDISSEVAQMIKASRIRTGTAHITAIGSTGSVTSIEYEPGVVQDLKNAVNRIAPPGYPVST